MYPDVLGTKCKKKEEHISSLKKKNNYGHSSRYTWNEKVVK